MINGLAPQLLTLMMLLLALLLPYDIRAEAAVDTGKPQGQEKNMALLPAIEIETGNNPDAAIIWLHGLGADGNDFAPIIPELRLPQELAIRFVFPHAPSIPVTINGGFVMPAWYDILQLEIDRDVDVIQLLMSTDAIRRLIDRELQRGIDSRRIFLAGFSQGGAVAYQTALSYPQPLGGLLAMSTYFATSETITPHIANSGLPIEVHHGLYDAVVPVQLGKKAVQRLGGMGYDVRYREYAMEHAVCAEQIEDIGAWLKQRLAESSTYARRVEPR